VRRRGVISAGLVGACAALLASGCGGGTRQDHGEAKRNYQIKLLAHSFQANQAIARPAELRIQVRNADTRTIPNVAITLDSFYYTEKYPELASDKRPIWVVEQGPGVIAKSPVQSQAISPPGGGQTAYVNTWALGPLAPGHTQTFVWKVVPVKSGSHSVHYEVDAGLGGLAKAIAPSGGEALSGSLRAQIAPAPPSSHVDPSTGRVVVGTYSALP
jgi:hypothetical protein